jgi:hypothetical protein
MFAQQTSLQVFPLAPVACRRQESSIFVELGIFKKNEKKRKEFFFLSKRGSKEPVIFILEIESTCFTYQS